MKKMKINILWTVIISSEKMTKIWIQIFRMKEEKNQNQNDKFKMNDKLIEYYFSYSLFVFVLLFQWTIESNYLFNIYVVSFSITV